MNQHFKQRCLERGITKTDPEQLFYEIREDIGKGEMTERVMSTGMDADIYRFRCADGMFYAIVKHSTGVPVTVITQKQLRYYKANRKFTKKGGARRASGSAYRARNKGKGKK